MLLHERLQLRRAEHVLLEELLHVVEARNGRSHQLGTGGLGLGGGNRRSGDALLGYVGRRRRRVFLQPRLGRGAGVPIALYVALLVPVALQFQLLLLLLQHLFEGSGLLQR